MIPRRIAAELPPAPEATVPQGAVAFRFLPTAVAGLALFVRLAALVQTRELPFFRAPIGDGKAYLDWSARIAAGDWSGQAEGLFYQAPFYPYLLAVLRSGFGLDAALLAVRLLQIALAALACGALVRIGERAFSRGAGLGAGLALALYAPAIVLDVQLAKESLVVSLGVLLLGLLLAAGRAPGMGLFFAAGLLLGVLSLLRESALLLAVAIGVWIWTAFRPIGPPATSTSPPGRRTDPRSRWLLVGCAGLLAALGPVAARNLAVGGELAFTTAQAGPNFYIGNHAGATGSYEPLRAGRGDAQFERRDAIELAEAARGHVLSAGAVSAYWFGRGLDFWQHEPAAAAALAAHKLRLALQSPELSDIEADWIYARASPVLSALGWVGSFGVLAPIAALGLLWSRKEIDARSLTLLLVWIASTLAGLVLFYVLGRYRVLLLPPLFLLAGTALVRLIEAVRSRRLPSGRETTLALVVLISMALIANGPGCVVSPQAPAEANLALAYALEGRFAEAEAAYRRALEADPGLFTARLGFGNLLLTLGRAGEAIAHLERAVALVPDDLDAQRQFATAAMSVRTSSSTADRTAERIQSNGDTERAP